jgi:3-deoxy-D-manno-octulosonic-acid transferase
MVFLYDLGILLYSLFIRIASLKNKKAQKWLEGRENLFDHIRRSVNSDQKSVWFHFASLGEFEQGRTVIEQIKTARPSCTVIVTFFSPSGYEIRKNYPLAAHVFYLPLDTRKNAERFIRLINPELAVFTKYEYWLHYFSQLNRKNIPLFMISAIFRKDQIFFRWYGALNRRILRFVTHFFVQNDTSRLLLQSLGFQNVTVTGDTRFDRVYENASARRELQLVKQFTEGKKTLVGGSTWPEDEALLEELAKDYTTWNLVIAPHEIHPDKIASIEKKFSPAVRYSHLTELTAEESVINLSGKRALIIDNVGMLSSLYRYGDIAFIGGGFGAGIHNTLEAAAFGLPVIFGPAYHKFQEAKDLISSGGGFSVKSYSELQAIFKKMQNEDYLSEAGKAAQNYVSGKTGATKMILEELLKVTT